uniref:Major sperm protein n=1 Tax=Parascaris equorum TaxID=6256 RepID=A0A914RED9_PAREQ
MTLTIVPSRCKFAANGGTTKLAIYNATDARLAFKLTNTSPMSAFLISEPGNVSSPPIQALLSSAVVFTMLLQVKTTNVVNYRVQPVYGFIEKRSKADLIILRLPGPPKEDKFYIQWADALPEETEPAAPFKAGAQI